MCAIFSRGGGTASCRNSPRWFRRSNYSSFVSGRRTFGWFMRMRWGNGALLRRVRDSSWVTSVIGLCGVGGVARCKGVFFKSKLRTEVWIENGLTYIHRIDRPLKTELQEIRKYANNAKVACQFKCVIWLFYVWSVDWNQSLILYASASRKVEMISIIMAYGQFFFRNFFSLSDVLLFYGRFQNDEERTLTVKWRYALKHSRNALHKLSIGNAAHTAKKFQVTWMFEYNSSHTVSLLCYPRHKHNPHTKTYLTDVVKNGATVTRE